MAVFPNISTDRNILNNPLVSKLLKTKKLLFRLLLLVLVSSFTLFSFGNISSDASTVAVIIDDEHCANFNQAAPDGNPVGPCIWTRGQNDTNQPAQGEEIGVVYYNCIYDFTFGGLGIIREGNAVCSNQSDSGNVSTVNNGLGCITNKDVFERDGAGIVDSPECKTALSDVCVALWDVAEPGNLAANRNHQKTKWCRNYYNNVRPTAAAVSDSGDAIISECQELTDADKAEIDKKIPEGDPKRDQFVGANYSRSCKDNTGKIFGNCDISSSGEAKCSQPLNDAAANSQQFTNKSEGGNGLEDIIGVIFNLISAILLILVWLLSWIVFWIFWVVASIFLILIQINPAGTDFIAVAIEPWKIVVSIANLLILGSFIFVGFAYLLNLKSFQKGLSEFITKVIIVAVTINFTIFGAATFVNITQGIGDVFVGGYASVTGQQGREVVGKLTNSLNGVSYVRCGSLPDDKSKATASAEDTASGINKINCVNNEDIGSQIGNLGKTFTEIGDASGENVQRLLREFIYLMIILYAIVVFARGIKMALLRVVGLWLLMIVSPLALVAYFSPFDKLKKYGQDWINYFWILSVFYPAFIFMWIVVGEISSEFTAATQQSFVNSGGVSALGGVTANAQNVSTTLINGLILVVLAGIVTVALMDLVIRFFDTTFKKIAEAGLKTLQDTVGSAFSTATSLYGKGIRSGGAAAAAATGGIGALKDGFSARSAGLASKKQELASGNISDSRRSQLQGEIKDIEDRIRQSKEKRQKTIDNIRDRSQRLGDSVEYIPNALGYAASIPKNFVDNFAKQKEARIARMDSRLRTGVERFARTNSAAYNALKLAGYELDADPNLSNFTGVTPEVYKSLKNQGRGDYLDKESQSLADRAYKSALGIKEKLDDEVLDILLDEYADQSIKGGKKPNLSKTQLRQALRDPGQRNKILRNDSLSDLVRSKYEQFNDPETRKIIQTQAPSLLPESQIADATRALSIDQIKELDPASADHPIVASTLQNMSERNPEIASLLNRNGIANGFSAQSDERAKRDLKLNNPKFANLTKENEQSADKFVQGMVRTGMPNERDVISKLSQMKAAGKSDAEQQAEYDRMTQGYINPEVDLTGLESKLTQSNVQPDSELAQNLRESISSGSISDVQKQLADNNIDENSELGRFATQKATEANNIGINKSLSDRNITDTQTREFIKTRIQNAHSYNPPGDQKSAKETHFEKVKSITTKAAEHIESYADSTVGDNLAVSTMNEIKRKGNIEQYLQDNSQNQSTIQALGLSGGIDRVQKSIDRGEITDSNNNAYFSNSEPKTVERAVKKYQKYAAAKIQGDTQAQAAIATEISNIQDTEAQRFFTEQVESGTGEFWNNIENSGKQKIQNIVDKSGGKGDADLRVALGEEVDKRKKSIEKVKETTARAAKKEGADKIYQAMRAGEIGVSATNVVPDLPDGPSSSSQDGPKVEYKGQRQRKGKNEDVLSYQGKALRPDQLEDKLYADEININQVDNEYFESKRDDQGTIQSPLRVDIDSNPNNGSQNNRNDSDDNNGSGGSPTSPTNPNRGPNNGGGTSGGGTTVSNPRPQPSLNPAPQQRREQNQSTSNPQDLGQDYTQTVDVDSVSVPDDQTQANDGVSIATSSSNITDNLTDISATNSPTYQNNPAPSTPDQTSAPTNSGNTTDIESIDTSLPANADTTTTPVSPQVSQTSVDSQQSFTQTSDVTTTATDSNPTFESNLTPTDFTQDLSQSSNSFVTPDQPDDGVGTNNGDDSSDTNPE